MNQSINLNLIPDGVKPVAKVSQFDVGRVVTFSLYQGPDVYTPPAGTTLEFRELKSDKHICVYDDAATLSGSTITLETTQQMTAAAGKALCQFKLTHGTEVLATLNFWLDVQTDPAAEGDISDSDVPAIIELATEQMERAEAAADSAAADAESAADSKEDAETAATSAGTSATAAEDSAEDAEAYAIGTRNGTAVPSTDPAYHNNSKYYSDLASAWAAHPPYVGANGDWYVYDPTTQQFVDTGIDASITIRIQDVTMLSYGSAPTVTNTGTSTDAVFHLGIPRAATIASVQKTSTSGLVDTYTMTLQDGTTFTYTVTNGADGQGSVSSVNNIQPVGGNVTLGLEDLNDVDLSTLSDGDVLVYDLTAGKWINGGAVGGGHTIKNPSGTAMAQRSNLQFKGNGVTVTDDSVNNTTVVEITGGGTTIVQKPTVTVGTYTYNGTAQGPTITWATGAEDNCVVTNATKTDAGTYTLTIALKNTATMVWNDLTTANMTYEYTINKATVTVPTVTDTSLTYNGSAQHPTVTGYDDTLMTRTGYEYTNAGSYTLVFSLIDTDNYEWSGTASFAWSIAKANQTLTLSSNSVTLDANHLSVNVTVSGAQTALSASSSDNTVATASVNNSTVTIAGVNNKNGSATITITAASDTNYNSATATVSVTASFGVVYGYHLDETKSDPAQMISYAVQYNGENVKNYNYTPAAVNLITGVMNPGSWNLTDDFFIPRSCMLKYDGTVDYYLNENDETKKADGTASDVANTSYGGNAMMEWGRNGKKIYIKIVPDATPTNGATIYISDTQMDSGFHAWSFYDCDGNEIEHFYTPKYFGSLISGKMRSISGQDPYTGGTGQNEVDYAAANNVNSKTEWDTETWCDRMTVNLLLLMIGKSCNTQAVFGQGYINGGTSASSLAATGTLNKKSQWYGSSTNNNKTNGVKVFGMEHWWGNAWRRVRGLLNMSGTIKYKLTYSQVDGSTQTGYDATGSGYKTVANGTPEGTTGGYVNVAVCNEDGLFAKTVSGSETTYFCDGLWFKNTQDNYAFVASSCSNNGSRSGALCIGLHTAFSYALWAYGAALSCKPLAS